MAYDLFKRLHTLKVNSLLILFALANFKSNLWWSHFKGSMKKFFRQILLGIPERLFPTIPTAYKEILLTLINKKLISHSHVGKWEGSKTSIVTSINSSRIKILARKALGWRASSKAEPLAETKSFFTRPIGTWGREHQAQNASNKKNY